MFRPQVRASFGRREAEALVALAGPGGEDRLRDEGLDALLDDPQVFRAFLRRPTLSLVPAPLAFYLFVRHAFLARQIRARELADYVAAVLLEFGSLGRARDPDAEALWQLGRTARGVYLVDVALALPEADGERAFWLSVHLGNLALWVAGLFPDYVTARVRRRGAPGLPYFDSLGAAGFRSAAAMAWAERHGLQGVLATAAERFPELRAALNDLSDEVFFPRPSDAVERLLRQVEDAFRRAN